MADFRGITEGYGFERHLQSYFMVFPWGVLQSRCLQDLLAGSGRRLSATRWSRPMRSGLSHSLLADGLAMGAYFPPQFARPDSGGWHAHTATRVGSICAIGVRGSILGWAKRTLQHARRPEWNVSAALADRALGRNPRLPMVKVSVLRRRPLPPSTPNGCSPPANVRHQKAFAGVRDYLRRTG